MGQAATKARRQLPEKIAVEKAAEKAAAGGVQAGGDSGSTKGSRGADTSFDFGANSF